MNISLSSFCVFKPNKIRFFSVCFAFSLSVSQIFPTWYTKLSDDVILLLAAFYSKSFKPVMSILIFLLLLLF